MSPFKGSEQPSKRRSEQDGAEAGENEEKASGEAARKRSQAPEGRRREGQRKLRAALDRAGDDSKPRSKRQRKSKRKPLKKRARAGVRRAKAVAKTGLLAVVTVLAAGAAILFAILGRGLALVLRAWMRVRPPARWLANRCRSAVNLASAAATPKRVLVLVVGASAILLALSQYADYRSVSIGADAYSGLEAIAPAPEVEREEAGSAHAYLFVPIGVLCLGLLWFAVRGRPGLTRLIAVAGFAAVIVAVVVDRPEGLDTSGVSMAFEGVEAKLLGGFYAQIAAGLVLATASLLLGRALNAEAPSSVKTRARRPKADAKGNEARVRSAEA